MLAYLQRAHDIIAERTEAALALEDPKERLLARQIRSTGFRGCAFIKAAAEFDDPEEPVRRAVAAHRARFARVIRKVFVDLGRSSPNDPVRHFVMLRDGAMVAGSLDGARATTTTLLNGIDGLLRHLR